MATRQFLEKALVQEAYDGGYVDVKDRWNKTLLGRLYFITFF